MLVPWLHPPMARMWWTSGFLQTEGMMERGRRGEGREGWRENNCGTCSSTTVLVLKAVSVYVYQLWPLLIVLKPWMTLSVFKHPQLSQLSGLYSTILCSWKLSRQNVLSPDLLDIPWINQVANGTYTLCSG